MSGPTGRHQAVCGDGHCALRGGPGRSKLEAEIFTLLDLALGPGISSAPIDTLDGRVSVDMLFPFGRAGIVVEYDGAYLHRDRVERDRAKSDALIHGSAVWPALVVRIREQPLQRLHETDISVPPGSDARTCARLAMLHVAHAIPTSLFARHDLPADIELRIHGFLQAGRDVDPAKIDCSYCRGLQEVLRGDFQRRWKWGRLIGFRYDDAVDGHATRPDTGAVPGSPDGTRPPTPRLGKVGGAS